MKFILGKSGSATILMMLIAAVIVTVGIGFNWLVREHIHASEGLKNKADAILKARSAYDTVIYLMLNGRFSAREIIIIGGADITELKTLPLNGQETALSKDVKVQIQDSNGMLSLAVLQPGAMERLIRKAANLDNAAGPVNCLLDWIDADDYARVNGAEALHYRSQGLPYVPRNYALQYKEEAEFIKGIGPDIYAKIQPYMTILPSSGFNPNTAADDVLMAYLDINAESLKTLKEYMSKKAVASNLELFALSGRRIAGEDNFFPSSLMDITVRSGEPKTIYRIRAGLNFMQNMHSPYSIVYWSEE